MPYFLAVFLGTVALSLLSGVLYKLGGWGAPGRAKFPSLPGWLFDTKARDFGCPLVVLGWMLLFFPVAFPWWIHALAFFLAFGALTTYWDELFGFDNFWFHGFMVALAHIPYAVYGSSYLFFGIRCVVLAVMMGAWCRIFSNDTVEEVGRGSFIVLTLPLLLAA